MYSVSVSLEELEFLLIKNKCQYLFGFPDAFIKINRNSIEKKFDSILDELENRGLISRSFNGDIKYNQNITNIIEIIKNVEYFYDISIIYSDIVNRKYRIYRLDGKYVEIEVLSSGNAKLDYQQMAVKLCDRIDITKILLKELNKEFSVIKKNESVQISVDTELYKKITSLKEEEFIKKSNCKNIEINTLKQVYKTITYEEKLFSVAITDMKKRTTDVQLLIYGMNNLFKMKFKKSKEKHLWVITGIDNNALETDVNRLFE